MLHERDSSLLEVHGRQGFKQRIGSQAYETKDVPRPAVPVAAQLSAQELHGYVATRNSTLHHDQRFSWRPASQGMYQHIGESCHRSARQGWQRSAPVQHHAVAR
ncbi:hypothetical protein [Arthrobacter sp. 2MCAF14]|uniref:hypothetical protein n=1 Tax=Arthrobacter sp. 2MCAF14 TaxID=3232982 RepID=UPI003F91C0CC